MVDIPTTTYQQPLDRNIRGGLSSLSLFVADESSGQSHFIDMLTAAHCRVAIFRHILSTDAFWRRSRDLTSPRGGNIKLHNHFRVPLDN
jgi:hypothetical protein